MARAYTGNWNWRTSGPPPANGQIETDTQTWATATTVYIANINADGRDESEMLAKIPVGSQLSIQQANNVNNKVTWNVTSDSAGGTGYYSIGVNLASSSGTLPGNNTPCILTYTSIYSAADALALVYIDPEEAGAFLEHLSRLFFTDSALNSIRQQFLEAAYSEWGYPDPYP